MPLHADNMIDPMTNSLKNGYRLFSGLTIVDLAGSERASRTQGDANTLKEGSKINLSLMTLQKCFDALIERSEVR